MMLLDELAPAAAREQQGIAMRTLHRSMRPCARPPSDAHSLQLWSRHVVPRMAQRGLLGPQERRRRRWALEHTQPRATRHPTERKT